MSVSFLGQSIVILNSAAAASDLLDKRSGIYSDRPFLMMGGELVGWKNTLALTPYGSRFRSIRRMLHGLMGTKSALAPYRPQIELESRRFLRRVLDNPTNVADATRKYVFESGHLLSMRLTTYS
jgi:cytochrome P450